MAPAVPAAAKERLRRLLPPDRVLLSPLAGRLAEALRRDPAYRAAAAVYVEPHPFLAQVRINVLVDGKTLLMPTAGMREGFTLLRPFAVPFPRLGFAVSPRGQLEHGRRIGIGGLRGLEIGLMVAGGGMAAPDGYWLGDGNGFLDLARAVLTEAGALAGGAMVFAAASASLARVFSPDPWDTRINAVITPDGTVPLAGGQEPAGVFWDSLPARRVRRLSPLWQLRNAAAGRGER